MRRRKSISKLRNKIKWTNNHKRKNGDDQADGENNEKDDTRWGMCYYLFDDVEGGWEKQFTTEYCPM